MTAPSVPRIRARKPKVRSGCATCKARRVKCGEERPICRRCQKSWLPCKYNSPSKVGQGERHNQPLESAVASFQAKINDKRDPGLLSRVQRVDFEEFDALYLDLFRSVIVENLCLNGYTNFWSRTLLREIFRDECVRDCVLGIGALRRAMMDEAQNAKSLETSTLWIIPKIATTSLSTRYQRDAIQYYTKSISKFRSRMSQEGSSTPRTILILSILYVMFEAMQGNSESIDKIMHTTMLALEDCTPGLGSENQEPGCLDDEGVREADYFFTRFSGYNSVLCPFYPSILRGPALQRNWSLTSKFPSWSDDLRDIELAFERYTTSSLIWCSRSLQASLFHHPIDLIKNQEEQVVIYHQANDWCKFISKKLDQETDHHQRRTWKMMLVEAKMFSIYATYSRSIEERELLCEIRIDTCREVVDLVESILDEVASLTTVPPLFEDKLLPTLRGITCKCRDYEIRMKALALCKRLSGPWFENQAILVGMRILIELEERERDESGFIPMLSRYRWNFSSFNDDRTELRMQLIGTAIWDRKDFTIRQDGSIDDLIQKLTSSSAKS
ncbi:hypothetical protein F4806DRAFT_44430 [Annulohypoxylon nitens]|nr:hypothetical protein F4806DRAFT_44430 [Annulohypoxylon nitens]